MTVTKYVDIEPGPDGVRFQVIMTFEDETSQDEIKKEIAELKKWYRQYWLIAYPGEKKKDGPWIERRT